jgi:hypothetical protein
LPPATDLEGYRETPPQLTIRTPMDVGPAKARRRLTAGVTAIEGTLLLTAAQAETLMGFWRDTTAAGALAFTWLHPRTGASVSMRFVAGPELAALDAGALWRAALRLEILP